MAHNITHEHVQHLARRGESLYKRLEKMKEKLSGATAKAVRTLEVSSAALVGGIIQGKSGPDTGKGEGKFLHVPIDLGAGLALNLLGYFDAAGDEYSSHLNNFGDGFLASYLSNLGFGMGNNWRLSGKFSLGGGTTPTLPPGTTTAPAVAGEVSPQAMAEILARVNAARG